MNAGIEAKLRRAVAWVAGLNLLYFGVEFTIAVSIGSVSLFADSVDFLEDTAVNLLILVALGWSAARRARVGFFTAGLLLIPGVATMIAAWRQLADPVIPAALPLTLGGAGALLVNVSCALIIARFRNAEGSLTKAAYYSARNDAIGNIAIILAGATTAALQSHWPDFIVGAAIFAMNLDAAAEVYAAARREGRQPRA